MGFQDISMKWSPFSHIFEELSNDTKYIAVWLFSRWLYSTKFAIWRIFSSIISPTRVEIRHVRIGEWLARAQASVSMVWNAEWPEKYLPRVDSLEWTQLVPLSANVDSRCPPLTEVNCFVGLVGPDISYVIFIFCATKVVQYVKLTWDIPTCSPSSLIFPRLFFILWATTRVLARMEKVWAEKMSKSPK